MFTKPLIGAIIKLQSRKTKNSYPIRDKEEDDMFNYSKTFFGMESAKKFAVQVNGEIWAGRDAFNQTIYTVKWN